MSYPNRDPIAWRDQEQSTMEEWASLLGRFRQELLVHSFSTEAAERICHSWLVERLDPIDPPSMPLAADD